jgi:hypothetical protein
MSRPPWQHPDLLAWAIVGMNHYHVNGQRMLFVAMTCANTCITAEGLDGPQVWERLRDAARHQMTAPTGEHSALRWDTESGEFVFIRSPPDVGGI